MTVYFLAASFLFGILLPTLQKFPVLSYSTLITDKANLYFFGGYTFYFVLGHYLYQTALSQKTVRLIYVCGTLASIVTIAGTALLSLSKNMPDEVLYGYLTPNVAVQAGFVFVFFKENISKLTINEKRGRLIVRLSALTFGMYLVHDFFNILFKNIGFTADVFVPVLSVPVITAAVFACSFVVTYLLDKIPGLRKCI